MSKYTAEQVRACILAYKNGDLNYCRSGIVDLLTEYASILDADGDGVAVELLRDSHAALGRMIAKSNDADKNEITVLCRLSDAISNTHPARSGVPELIEAARNASAILGHAYHTQITGQLADEAHDAYQRLDCAIASMGNAP